MKREITEPDIPYKEIECVHCTGAGKKIVVDGPRVRRLRQSLKPRLSGRAVAARLDISSSYLADMELGRREMSEDVARRILEICNA